MVEQTSSQGTKPNPGKTGSETKTVSPTRPNILKEPQNLFLIAEARGSQTALHDAVQGVNRLLRTIEQAGHNGLPTCMIPSYVDRLSVRIDASKALLARSQEKLNELVNIYSSFCYDTHQLGANLFSCKEKFIEIKRRCQIFLPDKSLNTSTASTLKSPETSPTGLGEHSTPTSPPGQWGDSQNTSTMHEDPPHLELLDYSGIQEMFMEEDLSNFQLRVRHILRVGRIQNMGRDHTMYGRVLGSSTNKYIRFCADSGTPAAFIPRSVAKRNKLEIFPSDPDEASYASASGHPLTVVGQTSMFVKFKTMKTTKSLRALVVAEEGEEVLVDLESLVELMKMIGKLTEKLEMCKPIHPRSS